MRKPRAKRKTTRPRLKLPRRERDLFGNLMPRTEADLVAAFVEEVRARGYGNFNSFRHRYSVANISRHVGTLVRAACVRAGFIQAGSDRAELPESQGHLVVRWVCVQRPARQFRSGGVA